MRRPDRFDIMFIGTASGAGLAVLWLGAGMTFFSDEWAFIESRSLGDPMTWFQPHNEHWATLPILVYRALVETVGLGSYVPYLTVLIVAHVTVASFAYVLIRRTSGPILGMGAGIVILLFGSGFENLYWAFQVALVGSLAAGLAALYVFDHRPISVRRAAAGTCLLVISIASSGIGLICWVAVGLELLLDPSRRRSFPWMVIPAAVYGAWFLTVGRLGVEAHKGLYGLGALTDVPRSVLSGLSAAIGSLTGVGTPLSAVVLVIGSVSLLVSFRRQGRIGGSPRAVGILVAIGVFYGLIAMARGFVGVDAAHLSRYSYVSGVLLAVGLGSQITAPVLRTPTSRRLWLFVGGLVFVLALTWNLRLLLAGRTLFQERAERTRALITVALERPLPPTTDPDRSLVLVPSPASLVRIVGDHGSPLSDWIVPWAVAPIRDEALADARRTLAEGAVVPLPGEPDASR